MEDNKKNLIMCVNHQSLFVGHMKERDW